MKQKVSGTPFWISQTPVPAQYPYLTENIGCDAAVIGGGIAGALCAYRLCLSGVNTVLVEGGLLGFGGTGASTSTVQYDTECGLARLHRILGAEKAVRVFRARAEAVERLAALAGELEGDFGFARRDCFTFCPDPSGAEAVREEFLLRRRAGFPVELYDPVRAADRFSFRVEAGIYTPGLGAEFDPYRLIHLLVQKAAGRGLRVFENTRIRRMDAGECEVTLETSSRYKITCDRVINASGAEGFREAGVPALPRTGFFVATRPLSGDFPGWHNRCLLRQTGRYPALYRTTPDGRILAGGLATPLLDGDAFVLGLVRVPLLAERRYNTLEQRLVSMFTGMDDIIAQYRFSGMWSSPGDRLPRIGERPGSPDVWYDLCGGPDGMAFAVTGADILTDLFHGRSHKDAALYAFGRE